MIGQEAVPDNFRNVFNGITSPLLFSSRFVMRSFWLCGLEPQVSGIKIFTVHRRPIFQVQWLIATLIVGWLTLLESSQSFPKLVKLFWYDRRFNFFRREVECREQLTWHITNRNVHYPRSFGENTAQHSFLVFRLVPLAILASKSSSKSTNIGWSAIRFNVS